MGPEKLFGESFKKVNTMLNVKTGRGVTDIYSRALWLKHTTGFTVNHSGSVTFDSLSIPIKK